MEAQAGVFLKMHSAVLRQVNPLPEEAVDLKYVAINLWSESEQCLCGWEVKVGFCKVCSVRNTFGRVFGALNAEKHNVRN